MFIFDFIRRGIKWMRARCSLTKWGNFYACWIDKSKQIKIENMKMINSKGCLSYILIRINYFSNVLSDSEKSNLADQKNAKTLLKFGKKQPGRLARYMNRMESGKIVLGCWDRHLSIGVLEWSVRVQKKIKKGYRALCC